MLNKNRIIHGTAARVYIDGVELAEISSFEVTETLNYEDVNANGDFVTRHRYLSSNIEGTATVYKVNSWLLKQYSDVRKTGVTPSITITGMLADPQTSSSQRVSLYDVQFTSNSLVQFENAAISSIDMPFTADSYEILDTLDD